MVEIVVIRSNSIIYNPRIGKITKSLIKKYSVAVLGWNREAISRKAIADYNAPLKLFKLRAPYGRRYLVIYFPIYWIWILIQLLVVYRPKAVHACDLDSAIPAYLYKIISGNKLVFDVCDRYAMGYIPPKFRTLYSMVTSLEELIGKKSDALINVSRRLLDTFRTRPKLCAIIMNCSEDRTLSSIVTLRHEKAPEILTLVYTGIITQTRGLKEIAIAIRNLENVKLDIAGRVVDRELLDEILHLDSNIKYHGLLRPDDALALQARSDVMMSLYDLRDPISNFSMGNKLFEAMMFGLPIITNVASELINEARCGIMVNYEDLDQIKRAIITLRDNVELRRSLGENGRQAYLEKYNWTKMEPKLFNVYDTLLGTKQI